MIKKKQISLFICICMMLLVFSGCNKGATKTKTEDPTITMKVALEKLNKVDVFSAKVTTENETVLNGTTTNENSNKDVVVQYNPFAVKMLNNSGNNDEKYLLQEKDTVFVYTKTDGQWTTQEMNHDTALASIRDFNVKETMLQFIQNTSSWQKTEENDVLATYQGVIPKDSLFTVLENTRLLQSVGMSGLTAQYFEGVPDLNFRIFINKETGYPMGYEVDLGAVWQISNENAMKMLKQGNERDIVKYVIKAEVTAFDKVEKIQVPQEGIDSAVDFSQQDVATPVVPEDGFVGETEE